MHHLPVAYPGGEGEGRGVSDPSIQVENLMPQISGKVDVLLFNPPYVVTSSEEVTELTALSLSWGGGGWGRGVSDPSIQVENLMPQIRGKVDVLVFNPPNVVTCLRGGNRTCIT